MTAMPGAGGADLPAFAGVHLSFDDGPDPQWTPRVLDLLAQAGVRATFFVIGCLARAQAPLARRIVADGHTLGNHTFSHRHPWTMLAPAARAQVRDGTAAIADATGCAPRLYRPPHGRLRRCMLDEAQRCGQALVLWNRSAIDWGPAGRAEAISRRLAAVRGGDIVLMHDGGRGINRPDQLLRVLPALLLRLTAGGSAIAPARAD